MQTHAETEKKERNTGVELLRIVSMLMVIILHILGQGGILGEAAREPRHAEYAAAYLLETCAYMATNCYALISGYAGADGHFRYARMLETQARVWFYTILITAGFCIAMPGIFAASLVKNALFPAMTGQYWYYTAYFGLMLFMPALQCLTAHLTKKQFRSLIVSIILLFSVLPALFVSDIFLTSNGYSLWWLMALYLTGAYMKKYGIPFLKKTGYAVFLYFLCVLITWGIWEAEACGAGIPLPNLLQYTSPAMLLAGMSLLSAFAGMRLPKRLQRAVSVCAPLSFSVYLIHAHPLVWTYLLEGRFASLAHEPAYVLVLYVIGTAAGIYMVCTVIDAVRAWLFRLCGVRKSCEKLEARLTGALSKK